MDFTQILSATMVLFAVIDIIGSIPIIISLRDKVGHIQSEKATLAAAASWYFSCLSGKIFWASLG